MGDKRTYNILFHLHTISGIIISAILYVIFFAGSFSFFRDEIVNWERDHIVPTKTDIRMDVDEALQKISEDHHLYGRDVSITRYYDERRVSIDLSASKDSLTGESVSKRHFFYLDTENYETSDYEGSYTLGEFLYRLHFLAQIPYPWGYYLSGFTAFFFLFAIITGILIHWKKIVSNFFVFRPWAKLKVMWTDAHTALGTIGFPFQFVYAVTGAFFMIKALLIAPYVSVIYEGDEARFYADLGYDEPEFPFEGQKLQKLPSINSMVQEAHEKWENFNVTHLHIFNYGDRNMHISIEGQGAYQTRLTSPGKLIFKASDQSIVSIQDPYIATSYLEGVKNVLYRIHFGDYGGYALKFISFILGLVGCLVIISGVMIWLIARDKKNISAQKRRFNEGLVNVYLSVCLSMYPVTALSFLLVKTFGITGMSSVYWFYFTAWLLLSAFFILKKDNSFTNKYTDRKSFV